MTNSHVVGDAARSTVTSRTAAVTRARSSAATASTDLAVLKIDATKPLPYVTFGDSGAAQVGDWVVAVGNPFGLGGTVTDRHHLGARPRHPLRPVRRLPADRRADQPRQFGRPDLQSRRPGDRHQHRDLFAQRRQRRHRLRGPVQHRQQVVAQLEAHGKVEPRLARRADPAVTPAIAASLGLHERSRRPRRRVTPDGPGAQAGLKQGDVILSFNGSEDRNSCATCRGSSPMPAPARRRTLTVWRGSTLDRAAHDLGGRAGKSRVAAARATRKAGDEDRAAASGLHLRRADRTIPPRAACRARCARRCHHAWSTDGSPAEIGRGSRGDVLMSINQRPCQKPGRRGARLRDIANSPRKNALLLLDRHGVTQYVGVGSARTKGKGSARRRR